MRSYLKPKDVILKPPGRSVVDGGGRLAIVVPVIQSELSPEEALSFSLLRRFGGNWPKVILHPEGLELCFDTTGFQTVALDPANFDGISAYNAMMMSAWFYELFGAYEHILIHQTDCLLLSDQIEPWLDKPWSYYGAPYFRRNGKLKSVGNGGFSLRRTADHFMVLTGERAELSRVSVPMFRQYLKGVYNKYLFAHLARGGGAQAFVGAFDRAEDEFYIYYAPLFSDGFKLPSAQDVVGFAAESRPRDVVALNGGRLPLGVHAWAKHDRSFWVEQLAGMGIAVP